MSNDLTTKQETGLTIPQGSWGTEDLKAENILIPRLALMQGQSRFVQDEKAKIGDIVDTVTGTVLANATKALEVIPLMQMDKWTLFHKVDGQWVYSGLVDATAANSGWHREWEGKSEDGREEKRVYSLLYYCLDASNYRALPYLITFKSTSLKAGKALMNHFFHCKNDNVPPASRSVYLGSKKESGDKNTWYVFTVSPGKNVSKEQLAVAYQWYKTLKESKHKVADEVDVATEAVVEQAEF